MTAMTEQDLPPCPFCGAAAMLNEPKTHVRGSGDCNCTTWLFVDVWNRRATIQPVAAPEPVAHMLPSDIKNLPEDGHTTAFYSDVTNTTTGERSVPVYTAAPAQVAPDAVRELSEAQKNTIRFAAEALEGLDYEDTAGDLREILRTTSTDSEKGGGDE